MHVNAFMMYVQAQMTGITCWPFASPTATSLCYARSMTCRRLRYAATWSRPCTQNGVTPENCWPSPERRSRPTRAVRRSTRISWSFTQSTVLSYTRRRFRTHKYVHVEERSSLSLSRLNDVFYDFLHAFFSRVSVLYRHWHGDTTTGGCSWRPERASTPHGSPGDSLFQRRSHLYVDNTRPAIRVCNSCRKRNEVVELFFAEGSVRFSCCRDWRWERLSRGNRVFNIFHYRRDWEPRWPPFSLIRYGKKKKKGFPNSLAQSGGTPFRSRYASVFQMLGAGTERAATLRV